MARRNIEFDADTTTLPVVPEDGNFEDATNIIKLEIIKQLGPITHRADDMANALCLRRSCLPSSFKMDDVISSWLNLNYDTSRFGQPCWNSLIKAIAEDMGGANRALAKRLADKYPPGTHTTQSSHVTPSMKAPQQEEGHPEVTPPVSSHRDTPLVTVNNPIAESEGEGGISTNSSTVTTSSSSGSFPTNSTGPFPTNSTEPFPTNSTGPFPTNSTGPFPNSTGPFSSSDSSVTAESVPTVSDIPAIIVSANCVANIPPPLGMGGEEREHDEEEGIDADRSNTVIAAPEEEQLLSMICEDGFLSNLIGGVSRHSSSPSHSLLPPALQPYSMSRDGIHGYALIINNINIDCREPREGAKHDGTNLATLFKSMGYKLVDGKIHEDLTAYAMIEALKRAMNIDHTHHDSFVCCLMSHGDSDHLFGCDDEPVYLNRMQQMVMNCKTLVGKPKMFFVQACRGGELPNARRVQVDDHSAAGNRVLLPEACDVFFGYATSPNTKACRFTGDGSWYVLELCKAFKNYPDQDLMTIVQIAHHEVATGRDYVYTRTERGEKRSYRQSPQLVSTLIKKFYFK